MCLVEKSRYNICLYGSVDYHSINSLSTKLREKEMYIFE